MDKMSFMISVSPILILLPCFKIEQTLNTFLSCRRHVKTVAHIVHINTFLDAWSVFDHENVDIPSVYELYM
jgi:hypothetical protein